MTIQLPNINEQNIIIFDIEYDQNLLVQLSFLILGRTEPNMFKLLKSFNVYVKQNLCLNPFFTKYTNITNAFLCDNGVDLAVAKSLVEDAISDIEYENCLIVSHGVKNDLEILLNNGIDFKNIKEHYCTYNMAKKLLHRVDHLTLKEIAAEGGYYMFNAHNAYADAWGELYAFAYLKELEKTNANS